MNIYKKIYGIVGSWLGFGNGAGFGLKNSSGVAEIRNAGDTAYAVARALRLQSGANIADLVTRVDLQGRSPNIEFSFDGGSPPSAGSNTGKFGFCHTTGGSYTAGDVVFDDGSTALSSFKLPYCTTFTTSSAVTGTISLIENGLYALQSGSWVLKGDGGGTSTGVVKLIEVPIVFGSGNVDSTTTVPDGARITKTAVRVGTAFNGTAPTVLVTAQGSSPVTLMGTSDSNLKVSAQYESDEVFEIGATGAGAIRAAVTPDSSSAGAATVLVEYTIAPLA